MSPVASTPAAFALPEFRASSFRPSDQPPRFVNSPFRLRNGNRRHGRLFCQTNPDLVDSAAPEQLLLEKEKQTAETESAADLNAAETETASSGGVGFPEYPDRSLNRRIAVISTTAAVGLFFSRRLDLGSVSLKDLSASALPYEEALSNGKPTVVEFYADWCEVCRELVKDVYKVEQQYKGRVNFVMLNVDNTKWEQELDEFGVEGIPHFAFLDRDGNEEGYVVGRLPGKYLLENVDALARGETSVPHARVVGKYSKAEPRKVRQVDPRSHG